MRLYSLINANGETYNLTDTNVIFHSTEGLGFESDNTYIQIGHRWIPIQKRRRQSAVTGTTTFYGDEPYIQYYDFVRFAEVEPLVLVYTTEKGTYLRNVLLESINKGEKDKAGALNCDTSFVCLTPWYQKVIYAVNKIIETDESSKFSWRWPVKWSSNGDMRFAINSDSIIDSPCKLIIEGPIKSPQWWHYANGVYQSRGLIEYDIKEGERLVIDSTTDPYSITVQNKNGTVIEDVYQLSNFDMERFIFLKKGINDITVDSVHLDRTNVQLEAYIYYDAV